MTTEALRFPYAWTDEPDLPRWQRVRAEGVPLRQMLRDAPGYLRKYLRGKRTAPPEEARYFDQQRRLIRALADEPEAGVRLALAGDLMWLRDGWGSFLSPEVLSYLNGHDAVVANLETPVSKHHRVPRLWPDYFTYNSDPRLVTSFRRPSGTSTFSALSTANNHSLDRGEQGLVDTLDFLDAEGIPHSGARHSPQECSWACFTAGGIRFGFYAACWGVNDPSALARCSLHLEVLDGLGPTVRLPVDLRRVRAALDEMAAAGVDFRIVGLHWGHEFEFYPTPELMQVGREVVRAGADVVMGSHPHVVQPLEVCFVNGYERRYLDSGLDLPALRQESGCLLDDGTGVPRKGLIAYSMGNFATAMYTLHCRTGLVLGLRLIHEGGRIDWRRPEIQFVYNARRHRPTGRRRLMLLERYLRECERRGDAAAGLRQLAAFLDRHLLGDACPEAGSVAS